MVNDNELVTFQINRRDLNTLRSLVEMGDRAEYESISNFGWDGTEEEWREWHGSTTRVKELLRKLAPREGE